MNPNAQGQGRAEVMEKPVLVGKVKTLVLTLGEARTQLNRILHSVNRMQLSPPRPMPETDKSPSPERPNSLELHLDDVQMSANELCREAGYLADRLEKLV